MCTPVSKRSSRSNNSLRLAVPELLRTRPTVPRRFRCTVVIVIPLRRPPRQYIIPCIIIVRINRILQLRRVSSRICRTRVLLFNPIKLVCARRTKVRSVFWELDGNVMRILLQAGAAGLTQTPYLSTQYGGGSLASLGATYGAAPFHNNYGVGSNMQTPVATLQQKISSSMSTSASKDSQVRMGRRKLLVFIRMNKTVGCT